MDSPYPPPEPERIFLVSCPDDFREDALLETHLIGASATWWGGLSRPFTDGSGRIHVLKEPGARADAVEVIRPLSAGVGGYIGRFVFYRV